MCKLDSLNTEEKERIEIAFNYELEMELYNNMIVEEYLAKQEAQKILERFENDFERINFEYDIIDEDKRKITKEFKKKIISYSYELMNKINNSSN